ncbi:MULTISPECIES: prepilin-type N-terminal cleavage/methylation domain-containing protein [Saccharospirillaceae]
MCVKSRWTFSPTVNSQRGVTLIELIIAIVVLSIAVVGILNALGGNALRNVDPQIRLQALAIAESYLDEALSKSFFPPDASSTDACAAPPVNSNRASWQKICDYNGYNSTTDDGGILIAADTDDPGATPFAELAGYVVNISVSAGDGTAISFGGITSTGSDCATLLRVQVNVSDPLGSTTQLVGYRAGYPEPEPC